MLQNWLKPLNPKLIEGADFYFKDSIRNHILLNQEEFPDLSKVQIAIIGIEEAEANEIRSHFYKMANYFPSGSIADLGNIRKSDTSFAIPLIKELLVGKITPVFLGGNDDFVKAQFLAYQELKALVSLSVVDEKLNLFSEIKDEKSDFYKTILTPQHASLFHFSLIGCQTHQINPLVFNFLTEQLFDVVRLGKSRSNIEDCEPIIRDADLMAFHLSALKQSEAPGVLNPSPSGYFSEEACQLCRYAGMSDKLTSFGIYGYQKKLDKSGQTALMAAQMLWYFTEGFFNRKNDFPISTNGLNEYIVELPSIQYQIIFWKSVKSGRWWMQVPLETKKKHARHRLVPCSYQDYQDAVKEELPERLMNALRRFS
jgi:formiminoglutamase